MKKFFIFTLMTVLLFTLTGCNDAGGQAVQPSDEPTTPVASEEGQEEEPTEQNVENHEEAKDTVVVVMGVNSEPEAGFDPAYGWGAGEHVHEPLIQSTLTITTQSLDIDMDLATDIQVSEDGLTWTVQIREDAYFTDGIQLTAEDVAFTYNTVKENSSVNDFTMLDTAEAIDDFTVRFHMNKPYAIWPYTMAIVGIVPAHSYGPDYGLAPVGSGRYMMKQWDRGQQIILEANPNYYGEQPLMRQVVVLFMTEDAAFAAVQAGQVDLAYTAATYSDQPISGYELLQYETVDNRGINLPAIPFDGTIGNDVTVDPAIRKAINMGINRDELIERVLNGYGTPAYSVCDKMPWFSPDSEIPNDFAAAQRVLEEAGWIAGDDGIRQKDGVRAEMNILYPASDSVRQALAAETSNQLKNLGIAATFEGVGWDVAYTRAQSEPLMWGWGAHTPMELYNIYHTIGDTGLAEYSPYGNSAVDAYMDAALAAASLEESNTLWQMAQWDGETGIIEDIPWVWLVNVDHLYWGKTDLVVAEQKIHPHGHGWSIVNNVDRWYFQN